MHIIVCIIKSMQFTWDDAKRKANLAKHRLDFADAELVFRGLTFTFEDDRYEYGEQRFVTIGILRDLFVVITYTERGKLTLITSMRKATKYEERLFFDSFRN